MRPRTSQQFLQAGPVHDVVVQVLGELIFAEMRHPALDPRHHYRMPQGRVRQVKVQVARLVAGQFRVLALHVRPVQEVGQSRQFKEFSDVLEKAVLEDEPAQVDLGRAWYPASPAAPP